jgi:8-oxo-dGTP diphosphatase
LKELPELRLDNREVVAARLILPEELRRRALTGPLAAYLGRSLEKAGGAVCCKVC